MEREQRSHHPTASHVAGRAIQHPEEQQRIQQMNRDVDVVRAGGIVAEELPIQRMREPCQRMPVRGIARRQRPLDGLPMQAGLDVNVLGDVVGVVVVGEGLSVDGVVDGQDRCRQHQAQQ